MNFLFWKPTKRSMPVWQLLLCFVPGVFCVVYDWTNGNSSTTAAGCITSLMLYFMNKFRWFEKDL